MFDLAKRFIRSSLATPVVAPVALSLEADFFILEGTRWVSLSDKLCQITFDEKAKGGPVMRITCDSEGVSESIPLDSVSNLSRFVDEDDGFPCFQWIVKKGKAGDNMDEFGVRFATDAQANLFASTIASLGQQSATVIGEFPGVSLVEKLGDGPWLRIEPKNVCGVVSKTKKGEIYLSVVRADDFLLFHSVVSPGLQISFAEFPYLSFIGLTPLNEDVRILGLQMTERAEFDNLKALVGGGSVEKLHKTRHVDKSPTYADTSDVEMWDDISPSVATRSRRRKTDVSTYENKFLETTQAKSAIVFSQKGEKFAYQAFGAGSTAATASHTNLTDRQIRGTMMHESDAKVLLLDSKKTDRVFQLDLERGSVVAEWNAGGTVNSILPLSAATSGGEKTFVGINDRSVFVMDPRVANPRVRAFNYATNVKLSAAATDTGSHLAVGSKTGEIRLFDSTNPNRDGDIKRAKSLLPGLGDPILHVTLTANGEWLLATCATYLVLVQTVSDSGESGFLKSMSKSTIEPIVLAISQADILKHKLCAISFQPAKFDEARGIILAATGSLAIMWDLKKIQTSGTISYSIKPMKDFILDAESVGTAGVVAMYTDRLDFAPLPSNRSSTRKR